MTDLTIPGWLQHPRGSVRHYWLFVGYEQKAVRSACRRWSSYKSVLFKSNYRLCKYCVKALTPDQTSPDP